MQNKLQELTDKLYREGLSKGQRKADQLLTKAKDEAAQIVERAKEEAAAILAQAQKSAEEAKINMEGEVKSASRQTMATVKQAIESLIMTKIIAEPTKEALSETDFIKSLVKTAIERFDPQNSNARLSVILPEAMQKSLRSFAEKQVQQHLFGGVDIQFDKTFKAGFKIGAKSDGFYISLTDKDFSALFGEYLRPHTRALLFGG
ncbi:MAG: hypothetical protein FWE30_01155 [Bacteroidales bacterium]|nr:hypothetical protein [Bacteroidales bacterium]MCL2738036.1 hypothetical protein [Bacteroidales bacterium]